MYYYAQRFRWRVTRVRELNNFDLGDGDFALFEPKMAKK
jgi:hypothetical protein